MWLSGVPSLPYGYNGFHSSRSDHHGPSRVAVPPSASSDNLLRASRGKEFIARRPHTCIAQGSSRLVAKLGKICAIVKRSCRK